MSRVVGVTFNTKGKTYFFSCSNELNLKKFMNVIVETEKGLQFGQAVSEPHDVNDEDLGLTLKSIIRIASKEDINKYDENVKLAGQALIKARKISEELKLNMRIIDASYTFDRNQLLFNFLADQRVDFRELAKKLAQNYKTRIELRQIGVRDKAKEIGGLGPCGRFLCCSTFLTDFNSVSINMAKNQMLALNPTKINGVCGRLLCCLNYEDDVYTELKKGMPSIGQNYADDDIEGKVVSINLLKRTATIETKSRTYVEVKIS